VILVDTGPLIALFDPRDAQHAFCRTILQTIREGLVTTVAVLTEAFHMLGPASHGARNLRLFIQQGGLSVWFMDPISVERAFELMEQYQTCSNDSLRQWCAKIVGFFRQISR
jgi:predicted nucleic acid-binding protein